MIGREVWKTMIVSKLMYGCGALTWYQRECDDLEVIQNGFGRWLWEVGNVRNELVRGESGWSSFAEREVKCIVDWLLMIVYEESLVSDIGRACLMEVGYKSRWWTRCNHVCDKFGLWELVNLYGLRILIRKEWLCLKYDRSVWKKTLVARIQEDGRSQWRTGFGINEREQQYVHMKSQPKNEKYANGSVGARVRLMVREGCLPVRGSKGMEWKSDDDLCVWGTNETRSMCFLSVNAMTW